MENKKTQLDEERMELVLEEVILGKHLQDDYYPIIFNTTRGYIDGRYYHSPKAKTAVIFAGESEEYFDSPAQDVYTYLSKELRIRGISSLRINYRNPSDLGEAVLDILTGSAFLENNGVLSIGLVGHSFGGAAVIQAAASSPIIDAVVALSTQKSGTEVVSEMYAVPILFIHGIRDITFPPATSQQVYLQANGPKELILLEDTGHSLNEARDEVYYHTKEWLLKNLMIRKEDYMNG